MSHPVTVENDALSIEVWPGFGGKVTSVIDKADGHDLLFTYPSEIPDDPMYDKDYGSGWYAGWDECFPAVAPSAYPGPPYDGIRVPDHGELWGLPTTSVPTKDGITTVWAGLRFGYRLTRKLFLDGPSLTAQYTLVNLAPFPFRFVWAMHALLAMDGPVEIEMGGAASFRYSHDAGGTDYQTAFSWPSPAAGEDLSRPQGLPRGRGWKVFSHDPIGTGPVVVNYPLRRRSLEIAYSSENAQPAWWGVWVNTGGWAGHRHFAIEPTTGKFDQIDRAVKDGSAGRVAPGGKTGWEVRWTLK